MSKSISTINIQKLSERPLFANILVYGESGVGKTTFASTAPRPILWLESEGGTHSIGDKEGIDVVRVVTLQDYRDVLQYLEANPGKYQTVVIDSFSETQALILKDIMKAAVKLDPGRDEFAPLFSEWGRLTGVMREIARAYRDLPMHTVITALTREDKDDLTGKTRIRPRLTPALADELPAFMDVCGFLYTSTPKKGEVDKEGVEKDEEGVGVIRNLLLMPTGKYTAKVRAPKGSNPPNYITDPTFDKVVELLK